MNIEEELRKAFQAGTRFGAVVYGTADTIDGERPLDEDLYVGKALRELAHQRVVEMIEGKAETVIDDVAGKEGYQ